MRHSWRCHLKNTQLFADQLAKLAFFNLEKGFAEQIEHQCMHASSLVKQCTVTPHLTCLGPLHDLQKGRPEQPEFFCKFICQFDSTVSLCCRALYHRHGQAQCKSGHAALQAISASEQSILHPDRHLLSCLLSILLQATVEPHSGQHIQPGLWPAQVLGCSNPAG